jgi:hypothetical protein
MEDKITPRAFLYLEHFLVRHSYISSLLNTLLKVVTTKLDNTGTIAAKHFVSADSDTETVRLPGKTSAKLATSKSVE